MRQPYNRALLCAQACKCTIPPTRLRLLFSTAGAGRRPSAAQRLAADAICKDTPAAAIRRPLTVQPSTRIRHSARATEPRSGVCLFGCPRGGVGAPAAQTAAVLPALAAAALPRAPPLHMRPRWTAPLPRGRGRGRAVDAGAGSGHRRPDRRPRGGSGAIRGCTGRPRRAVAGRRGRAHDGRGIGEAGARVRWVLPASDPPLGWGGGDEAVCEGLALGRQLFGGDDRHFSGLLPVCPTGSLPHVPSARAPLLPSPIVRPSRPPSWPSTH